MIIRLKVFEQTLSIVDTRSVPRKGSKDYLVLQFTFSSDWKDLNKLCYLQSGEVSQPIEVADNLVEVPEWFTQQDRFYVTLFGKSGAQEVPTNVVSLRLEKSNTLWEQDAPEPQPSWLAKVIDLNNHPPIPGENGYWLIWDTDSGAYVESELPLPAGGGVALDTTLSEAGKAADAKAVGDALNGKQDTLIQSGATVGQIVKITAVDDSGKPTAWKAVDDRLPNANTNDDGKALIVRQISEFDAAYVLEDIDSISLGIGDASPGQFAKVKYVDDFGHPIVWEAADMPSVPNWAKINMTGTVGQFISVSAVDDGGNVTAVAPVTIPNAEEASF